MFTPKVLCVADGFEEMVDTNRISAIVARSMTEGLFRLENENFDVVLVRVCGRDAGGAANILERFQQAQPATPMVIHAPDASATEAVRLLRLGAFHVFGHGDSTSLLYLAANSKWAQESEPEREERTGGGSDR